MADKPVPHCFGTSQSNPTTRICKACEFVKECWDVISEYDKDKVIRRVARSRRYTEWKTKQGQS